MFQSYLSLILTYLLFSPWQRTPSFQSYLSLILTVADIVLVLSENEFQSYLSLILTLRKEDIPRLKLARFNPTLVLF